LKLHLLIHHQIQQSLNGLLVYIEKISLYIY
jgi:hypothetical protein